MSGTFPKLFDSTLRDGSHAIRHQLTTEQVREYCLRIDSAGMDVVIVGHGNGLGASSEQVGVSATSDHDLLTTARAALQQTDLGVFVLPGFGTLDDLDRAFAIGVDLVCVAAHCTEADVTEQYIRHVRAAGKRTIGVLMMYHMTDTETLVAQAQKLQSYGAEAVLIMDSAGASTPPLVEKTITSLVSGLNVPVGFHAHHNLGMAVAHSELAVRCGAEILDGTVRGFGAGAGNAQLDAIVALLEKMGYDTGKVNLNQMLDAADYVCTGLMTKERGVSSLSIVSGLAGVFSGFVPHVNKAAAEFGVSPRDIFIELGRRKVVGGQEDMAYVVAKELANT